MMTEAQVVTAMRRHLEGLFPLSCPLCQREFKTFREYLQNTEHEGDAIPYDAELGRWQPLRPIGTVTLANCRCGNTLTLSSEGMPLLQLWSLLNWGRVESQLRNQTPRQLLNYLRDRICEQVLTEPEEP
ncbi:hypothetical protein [Prosthecobacter sp.]|uniref:hypothetical protein n=1 Tax=Prosthecobacter sp. TaxID=1965333 RepID=UPI00378529D6